MQKPRRRTRKIKEELSPNEVFRIYQKWVFKSAVGGRGVPIRFNWNNPPANTLSGFQRYFH